MFVLHDGNDRPRRIESIGKEEEGEEVDEGVRKLAVLLGRDEDLLPSDLG